MARGVRLLQAFLQRRKLLRSEFADRLPCSRPLLTMWLAGRRVPGRSNALAIERATGGAVPAASWDQRARRTAAREAS